MLKKKQSKKEHLTKIFKYLAQRFYKIGILVHNNASRILIPVMLTLPLAISIFYDYKVPFSKKTYFCAIPLAMKKASNSRYYEIATKKREFEIIGGLNGTTSISSYLGVEIGYLILKGVSKKFYNDSSLILYAAKDTFRHLANLEYYGLAQNLPGQALCLNMLRRYLPIISGNITIETLAHIANYGLAEYSTPLHRLCAPYITTLFLILNSLKK